MVNAGYGTVWGCCQWSWPCYQSVHTAVTEQSACYCLNLELRQEADSSRSAMCTNWWQCKHQWKQTSIKTGAPSAWWWVLYKLFIFIYINYALKCQEIYLIETFWGIHGSQCHVLVNGKFMHFSTHAMQVCVCVCVGYFDGWWAYLRRIEPVVFVIHTWFSL